MSEAHEAADLQPVSPSYKPLWPIYLLVTISTGASVFLSLLMAGLSLNAVFVQISIWTSVVCFLLVLKLVSKSRFGLAFLLSFAIAPIAFGIASLYFTTRSIQADVAQKSKEFGQGIVAAVLDPQPSLDKAIQAGAIRKATKEDIKAFRDAYVEKKYLTKNLSVPENEDALSVTGVNLARAYVLLDKFTYPTGLVDDYRVVFFVPTGVPKPTGEYGHSAIYHFDTLTVECTVARTGGISC